MLHTVPSAPDARPVFVAVDTVVKRAAWRTGATVAALRGPGRVRRLARARWAVMVVLSDGGLSLTRIGGALGGRDHSTVIHGLRRAEELMPNDTAFAGLVAHLRTAWTAARSG